MVSYKELHDFCRLATTQECVLAWLKDAYVLTVLGLLLFIAVACMLSCFAGRGQRQPARAATTSEEGGSNFQAERRSNFQAELAQAVRPYYHERSSL